MSNNYQPADWPGDNRWSRLQNRANDDVFEGRYSYGTDQTFDFDQYNRPTQTYSPPQTIQTQTFTQPMQAQTHSRQPYTYPHQYGRRCYVVCEPDHGPRHPRNPRDIARLLIGRTIQEAQRIYPNIRVVVRDGQHLIVTQDHRRDRINVETRNNVIIRILGFY
ncbi:hypothetical protein QJ856_gp1226 [Tupanvirus deep ocean]|uniref:Uncharacterized protein n=2 Tax=Tupanvirus TaxID=2094720 RepID=A0AC62A706_9VIRU|nr:hypothetical protein QJ856_gp1226 [Tupanvirus deep ocean]QKU33539.1 hypothetical protein [Tupanvirus deep ocean]